MATQEQLLLNALGIIARREANDPSDHARHALIAEAEAQP
jgi:hypothetical protein